MDDRTIIEAFFDRSEEAIVMLAETYGAYAKMISERIVHNEEDAEECVNDAYLCVWRSVPPECPRSLKTYLATVVRRLALNRYKHQHADKRDTDRVASALDELSECLPSSETPDAVTEDLVIREALNCFLLSLPERERRIFVRRYWYMDTVGEIARSAAVTENHVYVLLSRLRKRLKAVLEDEGVVL